MANTSIYAAFERMWAHVVNALSAKSDTDHTHDDMAIIDLEDNEEIVTTETYLQEQVNTLNQKFSNEENTSITTIDEFKEYLIDRVDGSCFGIYCVSNCDVVFGVIDVIIGTITAYNGNFLFDATSHWSGARWTGRFTSYDDTFEIKQVFTEERIKGFITEVTLTDGVGHLTYSENGLDGSGFAVVFSNNNKHYIDATNIDKYGCDITVRECDQSLVTVSSVWVTGIVVRIW